MNGVWVYRSPELTYARAGDDLLENIIVSAGDDNTSARNFVPGACVWTGDTDLLMLNKTQKPLLEACRRSGERRYLDKWSEITDDWALNYVRQADASSINERQLFVMTPLDRVNVFFKDLHEISLERPEFVEALPAATLARTLMLVSLLGAGPGGAAEPFTQVEKLNTPVATGFKAVAADGMQIIYLAADAGAALLEAGGVSLTGQALLLTRGAGHPPAIMALDAEHLISAGEPVATPGTDFQFKFGGPARFELMRRPIPPPRIRPDIRNFVGQVKVTLDCPSPGTTIYYTTDATDPVPWNPAAVKYAAPFMLDRSMGIKTRAFRTAWLSGQPALHHQFHRCQRAGIRLVCAPGLSAGGRS